MLFIGLWPVGVPLAIVGAVLSVMAGRGVGVFTSRYARRLVAALRPVGGGTLQRDRDWIGMQQVASRIERIKPPTGFDELHRQLLDALWHTQAARERRLTAGPTVADTLHMLRRQGELDRVLSEMRAKAHGSGEQQYVTGVADDLKRFEEHRAKARSAQAERIAVALEKLLRVQPPPKREADHHAVIDSLSKTAHYTAERQAAIESGDESAAVTAAEKLIDSRERMQSAGRSILGWPLTAPDPAAVKPAR